MISYNITKTWNGGDASHEPITVSLEGDDEFIYLKVDSPLIGNPSPPGPRGEPYWGIWYYEGGTKAADYA